MLNALYILHPLDRPNGWALPQEAYTCLDLAATRVISTLVIASLSTSGVLLT